MKTFLLLGCGNDRGNRFAGDGRWDGTLVTLDMDERCRPDVIWDLYNTPLPFDDNLFDEIHAYEVLEHVGVQGDFHFFFRQFDDFARMLKPEGKVKLTVPWWKSEWALGDPGHTRVLPPAAFVFLDRTQYTKQVGVTAMSDYRVTYKSDFEVEGMEVLPNKVQLCVVLKVRK